MPFARLTINAMPLPMAADDLARELTNLIARDLGKHHALTSVLVEVPSGTHWTIGAELRPVAAHLEVCVTRGTNTDEEKRAFVAHSMALLHHALPGLDPATYVVVKELGATDWGYDGLTQADRAKARL